MKTKLCLIIATLFLVNCGAQTPKRTSPEEVLSSSFVAANRAQLDTTPKLDVLIVVDNSLSMMKHQVDLEQNIPAFVKDFTDNATIDFHIGVVTIWDSDPTHEPLVAAKYKKGELVPLQDPSAARGTPLLINGSMPQHFVTRDTPNLDSVLQSTILLGEDPGPEFEEMFSPVEAFFKKSNSAANTGFYRSNAHLLVIFLTDANDSTTISADQFYTDLLNLKGGNKGLLHFYSIIWRRNIEPSGKSCEQDHAGYPEKFLELSAIADGNILDICADDFGSQLAKFGKTLSVAVARQTLPIQTPDASKPFSVTYGSQQIPVATPPGFNNGYLLDTTNNQVIIPGDLKLNPEPGAKIEVHYTPITADSVTHGRVKQLTEAQPSSN